MHLTVRLGLIGFYLCMLAQAAFSQCKLIDGSQGSVYLTFEKTALVSVDGKTEKVDGAIFQIHNNSSCPILLTTGDASSFYKPLPPNATVAQRLKREINWVLPEGALVPYLQYLYRSRRSSGRSVGGDSFFQFQLIGGQFIRFEVPLAHLDPTFANELNVDFDYLWETDNADGIKRSNVTNRVTYWIGSLPEEIQTQIKKSLY